MFTRLLCFWVTGALLLLLKWGSAVQDEDYFVTPTSDYDYNYTFEYYLYNETKTRMEDESHKTKSSVENRGHKGSVSIFCHFGTVTGLLLLFCH